MSCAHRASASKAPLLANCAWWARPDVDVPERPSSSSAKLGSAVHRAVERWCRGEALGDALAAAAEEFDVTGLGYLQLGDRALSVTEWLTANLPKEDLARLRAEVPFALDFVTGGGRELPKGEHRDYSATTPEELPGTADLVIDAPSADPDSVDLYDLKTGYYAHLTEPARDSLQLATLGTAAARAYGRRRARVVMLRATDEAGVLPDSAELTEMHFEAALAVAEVLRPESLALAEPHPGPWCEERHCDAFGFCPATSKSLAQIAAEHHLRTGAAEVPLTGPIQSMEVARVRLALLSEVRAACEAYEDELRAWSDAHGGIPTSDGRLWVRTEQARQRIVLNKEGIEAIVAFLGEEASEAIQATSSKTAIARACKKVGNARERQEALLAELAKCGAIRESTAVTYEERKACALLRKHSPK